MSHGSSTTPRPPVPPFSWSRTLMIFLVLLTIMVLFDPNLSKGLGVATSSVLDPIFGFGGHFPVVTVFLAAILTTTLGSVARHYFSDWVKIAKVQKENSALQKALMDAYRKRNLNKVQKLNEKRREMSAANMSVQLAPMKSLAFTFLAFILVYAWLNNMITGLAASAGTLMYAVPWQFQTSMVAYYLFPSWILLYMLFNIFLGQLISRVLKFFSFRKKYAALIKQSEYAQVLA